MKEIKSLGELSFDELHEAFTEAFKDYEVQLNKEQLHTMLLRRGFNPQLSFGAFKDNKLISFTCNGIGSFNGVKSAYDTGTGTIEEYRGQGHATKIFTHSIPFLKEAGIKQYVLEVLQHNTKAVSIYTKLGFETSREFNYFVKENQNIKLNQKQTDKNLKIKQIDSLNLDILNSFHDFSPSWQNSFEAILRKKRDFVTVGAFDNDRLLGYCILEPQNGDLTQIAVEKNSRRKGIGTLLLKEVLKSNLYPSVKIINTQTQCESITAFLQSNSFSISGKQFEMIKQL